jgi:hypothetical protein
MHFQPAASMACGVSMHASAVKSTACDGVQVHAAPHVAVLSTGDEVADPATPHLRPGAIRDANSPMLLAAAADAGASTLDLVLHCFDPDLQAVQQRWQLSATAVAMELAPMTQEASEVTGPPCCRGSSRTPREWRAWRRCCRTRWMPGLTC